MEAKLRQLPEITADVARRFWLKVAKGREEECWLWVGAKNNQGRGMLGVGRTSYLASRIAWAIHHQSDPYPLHVLHNCPGGDNTTCVNPGHLYLGDLSTNMRDAYAKGQKSTRKGLRNKRSLTPEQEAEVKLLYQAWHVTLEDLAKRFNVGASTIHRIVKGYFD